MAYDEILAERINAVLSDENQVTSRKMFGGIAFMVRGNMCAGVIDNKLMARVGPDYYSTALAQTHAHEMTVTGRPMKGMVFVEPEGIETLEQLKFWIGKCLDFVKILPVK